MGAVATPVGLPWAWLRWFRPGAAALPGGSLSMLWGLMLAAFLAASRPVPAAVPNDSTQAAVARLAATTEPAWVPVALLPADPVRRRCVLLAVGGLVAILVFGVVALSSHAVLKRQVARRTAELKRQVAERRRAEAEIAETEHYLEVIITACQDGILVVDAQGRLEFGNEAAFEILGWPGEELIGTPLRSVVPPAGRSLLETHWQELRSGRAVAAFETDILTCAGDRRCLLVSPRGISIGGQTKYSVVIRDMTSKRQAEMQRRRLEQQLQQARKLESLGALAGGVAHDFNNLLVGILGNASIVLDELPSVSPLEEPVRDIERSAAQAAELCRQMLAFSGKGHFVVEPFDPSELLAGMRPKLKTLVPETASLEFDLPSGLPPVEADAGEVRQVVMNLVTNAAEALPAGEGTITVRTGSLDCDAADFAETSLADELPAGPYVFVDVTDNGCGMEQGVQERAFEPFFSTKFVGRGLGLAVVLGIVRGHRGALRFDSSPGRGTAVRVLLPASPPRKTRAPEMDQVRPAWRGAGKVLVIDDEERVRHVTGRLLERLGFNVVSVADSAEAVSRLSGNGEDVVCAIVALNSRPQPERSSLTQLRAVRPGLPIVFAGPGQDSACAGELADEPAVALLPKPFDARMLAETLEAIVPDSVH